MPMPRRQFLTQSTSLATALSATLMAAPRAMAAPVAPAAAPKLAITTPMAPPEWALLQRAVLSAHTDACEAFFRRYYDANGFLLARERWGGDDGPDDAIENVNDWPQLYALGADERIRTMYEHAYEGHVRQYTLAKTTQVPFAREGMYFREFPVMMDWQHNGEGLTVFNNMGLGNPYRRPIATACAALPVSTPGRPQRPQLRQAAQDHQIDVQRQPWAADAQGHRAGLGGRSGGTGRRRPERPAPWRA
jgi:hypothetical protein